MPRLSFTDNLQRHVACPSATWPGETVRQVLESFFAKFPAARGYVLDDQGCLRQHMVVFVDGRAIGDRRALSDAVDEASEVYVYQALSGG